MPAKQPAQGEWILLLVRNVLQARRVGRERFFELCNDFLVIGDLQGRILDANPRALQALGYAIEDLRRLALGALVHAHDRGPATAALETLRRVGEVRGVELRVRTAAGRTRRLSCDAVACRRTGLVHVVARDAGASAVRRIQAAMLREAAARVSMRLAAEQLASEVTHRLRQPLAIVVNSISAAARFIDKGPEHAAQARQAIQRAVDESLRAGELLDAVYGRLRAKRPEASLVDVGDVARRARAIIDAGANGDREPIRLELSADAPVVSADATLLEQAVVNLLANAIEATETSAHPRAGDRTIVLRTRVAEGGAAVEISVADHGDGVPHEEHAAVLEPFGSSREHGLGLGLTTVRRIVERHRGRLRIADRPGGGAIFTIVLAAAPDASR